MENYDFNLIGAGTNQPFGGYISEVDKTTLSPRFMVKGSKNVYRKRSGAIANRPGLKRRGAADTTNAGVLASFEWYTSLGTVRPLRVADGNLQVESDIASSGTYVWYSILTGLTNTRLVFDTWWDNAAKKDLLLFCDGTDDMKYWSGALALISGTTATTISFASNAQALGFDASGTVLINGTEYAYTARSGTDLTGVTPDPTSEDNNSVALQKPVTDSDTIEAGYEIDFIRVVNNQVYFGSETSRLVRVSKNTDWDDVSSSSPRATGEGDTIILDEVPTGIGVRKGMAHIATRRAWYEISFNQITIGSSLSEQTRVYKRPLAVKEGALRHEFIASVGDDLVYLSEDQQLILYSMPPSITDPRYPALSEDIRTELKNEDFTNGHIRVIGNFIYLTAPNNGRVWLHETVKRVVEDGTIAHERLWHPPFIWNLSRIAEINNVEYGHSNAHPQLYQMWDTLQWHDDSPSDEDIPYTSMAVFSYRNVKAHSLLALDGILFEGYMTPGSQVSGAVAFEYQGERTTQQIILNNSDQVQSEFYIGDIGSALGDASLGDNPLGDQTTDIELDQDLIPKFRVITELETQNVFEYQPRVYSTNADDRWELLRFGGNEVVTEDKPTSLLV